MSEPSNILKEMTVLLMINREKIAKKIKIPCENKQPTETKDVLPTFPRIFPGSY